MDTKYGKLISRDKNGQFTEVYPEIRCDHAIDYDEKRSVHPISNYVLANEFEKLRRELANAFTSENGGLGWDVNAQKGYIDFSRMPKDQIEDVANSIVDPDGAVVTDPDTGKLTVDFSKLTSTQIMTICDPNGAIVTDPDTGKLTVDFSKLTSTQIMTMCDPNGGITSTGNGQLAIDFSKMPKSQIEGVVNSMVDPSGAIIADPNSGKLTVDFSKLTVEQIMNLCAEGGGIAVNEETGKLKIDFSTMPTDKFEEMLSAMKMQVPLESNLNLYVDVNSRAASDEITSNRGTAELPFASIAACINYATQKYALGNHDVWIHIKEGIYYTPTEIVLPYFTRTSGSFYLISEDGYGKAIVRNSSPQNTIFYSSGGSWHFIGLAIELTTTTLDDGYPHHPTCLTALYGPDIFIESCKFTSRYIGERTSNSVSIRGVAIDLYSNLYIVPNNMGPTIFHVEQGNVPYNGNYAIYVAQNSHAYFMSTNTPEINNAYNVYFSGKMTHVFLVGAASAACTWGGALYSTKPAQNPNSSLDAQTYNINGSSYMAFGNYMLLPKTGYIDESTYCWYR